MTLAAGNAARRLVAGPADAGERLDRFVQSKCPDLSRSRCSSLVRGGHVIVNGVRAKPSAALRSGDVIEITVPPPVALDLIAQDIPLTIIYQDAHVLVVDKPAGLTVHPAPGHPDSTLVNALLALMEGTGDAAGQGLSGIGGVHRPGIVHRLDKDTSGLIVVAKTDAAHASLTRQLKERKVKKTYAALVHGLVPRDEGAIEGPISRHPRHRQRMAIVEGGRDALTRYRVVQRYADCTLVEAYPVTGRTHQIRVHFAAIGHALFGDALYGRRSPLLAHQFLHAA
ncbi:MAG: RluA family pseudouridine synthase, partial [Dehalococcoidia bacterium]